MIVKNQYREGGTRMKRKFLCIFLVLAMALTCGCQSNAGGDDAEPGTGATEAEEKEALEDAGPDADDAAATADDADGEAANASAAGEWVWVEEPSYLYDDVEPIHSVDFSDGAYFTGSVSDGWERLLGGYFCELNFPQYSCTPEYYLVSNGSAYRLFYMPDRIDSGTIVFDSPVSIIDSEGISFYDFEQKLDYPFEAPWDVAFRAGDRGAGSMGLYYDAAEKQAYIAGGFHEWTVRPLAEAGLHKPYPIQLAKITKGEDASVEVMDEKYAFAAPDGRLITDFVYDEVDTFSDGIAAASRDGSWEYINDRGETVAELAPGSIAYPCTCDTMVVRQKGGMGLLYRDGSVLIDFGEFEDMAPAWNNELWVRQNGKWGLLDLGAVKKAAGHPEWDVSQPYSETAEKAAAEAKDQALMDFLYRDLDMKYDALPPEYAGKTMMVATGGAGLNVRSGPGADYERIGSIADGSYVRVYFPDLDGWVLYYDYDEDRYGWVSADYLE